MSFRRRHLLAAALLPLAACSQSEPAGPPPESFRAQLTGANTVPATTTTASGTADFQLDSDTTISFTLEVTGITGVTQAHLHAGAAGRNGTTLVWLLPVNGTSGQTPSVDVSGLIAEGRIERSWIRGSSPISLDSLKQLMRNGEAYVDIHTSTRTGGEVRGQVARTN